MSLVHTQHLVYGSVCYVHVYAVRTKYKLFEGRKHQLFLIKGNRSNKQTEAMEAVSFETFTCDVCATHTVWRTGNR